ncbi:MAG TPA: ABC transporter ATP-binding protein [Burkholderiales bacterium]|nr:ABC transporter ATP-binding protein [Burkholderiales bacterium]
MLRASGLRLQVPGRILVDALDFDLQPGRCCALLGRNGSGKSSLLLALAGLRPSQGGEVRYADTPLPAGPQRALHIGALLQDEPDSFWGSTLDYVALGRVAHAGALVGIDDTARALALKALRDMDLDMHASQSYRSLSGGERQRARIAQVLTQDPQVFLLDEPLTHLDLGHQLLVMEHFAQLTRLDRSVLMSLHEPLWAASYCADALLLYDAGRFRLGSAREVLTIENLEALYGCRLESVISGDRALFIPSTA